MLNVSRREWLSRAGLGCGMPALSDLVARAEGTKRTDPLAPKQPHFPAKAKAVIRLFMHGGPSQVDIP